MVSTRPVIFKSSSSCTNPLVTVPRAPIIIGITITFMFHSSFQSPQVPRTVLIILAVFYNAVVWMVSRPLISNSSAPLTKSLSIVSSAPITTGIAVIFMFHTFSVHWIRVFPTSVSLCCFFWGLLVTTNLFRSLILFLVIWSFSTMPLFG